MTPQKVQGGTPSRKPSGARGTATLIAEGLSEDDAMAIVRAGIGKAMAEKTTTVRICIERDAARREDGAVGFALPPLDSAAGAP